MRRNWTTKEENLLIQRFHEVQDYRWSRIQTAKEMLASEFNRTTIAIKRKLDKLKLQGRV